jgi:two-component system chemotaxis response regulator CheB
VDPLFRTAAVAYGARVIGVILSGTLDDGTAGLKLIKMRRGKAICQDPQEAMFDSMPRTATEVVDVDFVLPLAGIAEKLVELARERVEATGEVATMDEHVEYDNEIAKVDMDAIEDETRPGVPSVFGCPECGGVLWERDERGLVRFRCRVGHAYSPDVLLAEQGNAIEVALWTALRALEERVSLLRRLLARARERGHILMAARYEGQIQEVESRAAIIQNVLLHPVHVAETLYDKGLPDSGGRAPAKGVEK